MRRSPSCTSRWAAPLREPRTVSCRSSPRCSTLRRSGACVTRGRTRRSMLERRIERYLTPHEYARLASAIGCASREGEIEREASWAFRLLMLTGCRLGEILRLQRSYVDQARRELILVDAKAGGAGGSISATKRSRSSGRSSMRAPRSQADGCWSDRDGWANLFRRIGCGTDGGRSESGRSSTISGFTTCATRSHPWLRSRGTRYR